MTLNDASVTPLSVGSLMPQAVREMLPLHGQNAILVFSPTEWNPSHVEQLTLFYNALARAATKTDSPVNPLNSLHAKEMGYSLHFDDTAESVTVVVRPTIDSRSEAARAFGVQGQHAVFVVDAEGIIRFQSACRGAMPDTHLIVTALRDLHIPYPAHPFGNWHATRRDFVASVFAGAIALMFGASAKAAENLRNRTAQPLQPTRKEAAPMLPITLQVNGQAHTLQLDPRVALLDALREHIGLTGSKKGCDHGQCGACTVHLDGERVLSCLTLAAQAQGASITTIEGLAQGDTLHPVQEAFIEHDGYQCGYCTPGQIMSAVALLKEGRATTDAELCEGMSGNLCRCAAYPHILASIKAARDTTRS